MELESILKVNTDRVWIYGMAIARRSAFATTRIGLFVSGFDCAALPDLRRAIAAT